MFLEIHQDGRRARRVVVALLSLLVLGTLGCGDSTAERDESAPTATAGHRRMLELLQDVARRTPDEHVYFGDLRARQLRERVSLAGDAAGWRESLELGVAELRLGNERVGLDHLKRARALLLDGDRDPSGMLKTTFYLGVGHLRLGETENCCARRTADSCILPIRGGGLHSREEGSRGAIPYFEEVIRSMPADDFWHRSSRWLLNIAYMTLDEYPDGVPPEFRIPEHAFRSEIEFPRFVNIADRLGVDTFSLAGSVVLDDFDGDDDIDLMVSTWDSSGQLRFFRNDNDGFTDRTDAAGLTGLVGGLNMVQADYDNDDDLDLLVLRGAWLSHTGRHPNSLVRNNGDGTFSDVTFDAGLGEDHFPTQTAAWADYDNDGDLDLYIGNEATPGAEYPSQLFRNEGDGTFTERAAAAGVENLGHAKGVVWGDYDSDGDPDIFVSNKEQENRLYRNNGDGTFTDVAPDLGVTRPLKSFPVWFWDYDNDGVLDLFVSAFATGVGHLTDYFIGRREEHEVAALYRGDGKGGFSDVAVDHGLDYPSLPMGANFGDLDGDGWLDFYLGTGNVFYFELMPNVMYLNRHGESFVDVTMAGGFGHLQKGHGVAFADLDNDGDLDVFGQMGGAFPGDRFADALYENPGFGNRWLSVKLVGRRSNRSAIGARIRIDVEEQGRTRSIWRHVGSGGSFGANPLRQTIGLGDAERILRVDLFWPTTGESQTIEGVTRDAAIEIVEGEPGFRVLALEPRSFRSTGR